jgi:N-acetylglucosamine malate deacetylase 2
MQGSATPERFLAGLAGDESLAGPSIAVVVAHPDDETIGVGAQLPRMPGVTIVHVTDGAPRRGDATARQGFESAEAYAAARRRELEAAMALVGVPPCSLHSLGIADQDAARHMVELARRLARLFAERNIAVVLTHAYEGGHPDHDAAAFAARWAARLAGRLNPACEPLVVEMPLYHASPVGWVTQAFADVTPPALSIWLDDGARSLKARLYAAHASQAGVLTLLPIAVERFRHAPDHDFDVLPNRGDLLYEREEWGLTGAAWREQVAAAEATLREDLA